MFKRSRSLAGIISLLLSTNIATADTDIIAGSGYVNMTPQPGVGYESGFQATIGVNEMNSYWDANPGSTLNITSNYYTSTFADINLGYAGGQSLSLGINDWIEIRSNITGSAVSGEGGSLYLGRPDLSYIDSYFVVLGGRHDQNESEFDVGTINDIDSLHVNTHDFFIDQYGTLTVGENDSVHTESRYLNASNQLVRGYHRLLNWGTVEQLGANSSVIVEGDLAMYSDTGSYSLQGGSLSTDNTYVGLAESCGGSCRVTTTGTFEQYAGTTHNVAGDLIVFNGSTYTMYGGQLNANDISADSTEFIYIDGGVRTSTLDVTIEADGMLGESIIADAGEQFGFRNMTVGNASTNSGSVVMDGGSNDIVQNLTVAAGGSFVQNTGTNTVGQNVVLHSGSSYTMNGGQLNANVISTNGSFHYVNGGVKTRQAINISAGGLFGDTLLIDEENEIFGASHLRVGTDDPESGSVIQSAGKNLLSGTTTLEIAAGGRYELSGGQLEFKWFTGPGKIDFTGGEVFITSHSNIGVGGAFGESLLLDVNKKLYMHDSNPYSNDSRGDLTVDAGADLVLDGGSLYANQLVNNGTFNYRSGRLDLNSMTFGDTGSLGDFRVTSDHNFYVHNDITIEDGTTLRIASGGINGGATINNSGSLILNGGSTGLFGQTVGFSSTKTIHANTVNVEAGSRLAVNSGISMATNLTNQGVVVVGQSGQLDGTTYTQDLAGARTINDGVMNTDVVIIDGLLRGSGIINGNLTNGGDVNAGNSPGTMTIDGDYIQTASGTLIVELGGLLSGSEYDVLDISGEANLGGTLDVNLYDMGSGRFSAGLGDTFDILMAETIVGEFDLLSLAWLGGGGLGWDVSYITDAFGTTDIVRLSVVTSAVPVPAAVWLFGSGLLGLIGFSRKRKVA